MTKKPGRKASHGKEPGEVDVPEEVHADFEQLLNHLISEAMEDLAEEGYVEPFGAILEARGATVIRAGEGMDVESMGPEVLVDALRRHLRDQVAGNPAIVAVGVIMEVTVDPDEAGDESESGSGPVDRAAAEAEAEAEDGTDETIDALALELEHRRGDAHVVLAPLVLDSDGALDIGAIWASQGEARIFVAKKPSD